MSTTPDPAAPSSTPAEAAPPGSAAGAAAEPASPSKLRNFWTEWIRPFLFVLLVVFSFRSAVADWNDVPTGSMRPTILEGERIFVNKLAYDLKVPFTRVRLLEWENPQRGDVVVLYSPAGKKKRLVKRVVGVPGDRISMINGRVQINGELATYRPFGPEEHEVALGLDQEVLLDDGRVLWETMANDESHPVIWRELDTGFGRRSRLRTFGPTVVPEGSYFVMGDNRDNSSDSRSFGFVERELIVGEATTVVFSLDPERHRAPRWSRFFLGLP